MNKNVKNKISDLFKLKKSTLSLGVGLSGGVDSVVLADILLKIYRETNFINKLFFIHFNHNLRGKESDKDEEFVKAFSKKNDVKHISIALDVNKYSVDNDKTIEESARILRYEYFSEIREKNKIDYICLAHHKDDIVETVLFNIFRGTGLAGLTSLKMIRDYYFRPILDFTKVEIAKYAEENSLEFRQDKTNFENEFSRNKIRNIIIPSIEENLNRKISNSIMNLSSIAEETLDFIDDYFDKEIIANYDFIREVKTIDPQLNTDFDSTDSNMIVFIDSVLFNQEKDLIKKKVINYSIDKLSNNRYNYNLNFKDSFKVLEFIKEDHNRASITVLNKFVFYKLNSDILITKKNDNKEIQNYNFKFNFSLKKIKAGIPLFYNYFNLLTVEIGYLTHYNFRGVENVKDSLNNNELFFIDLKKIKTDKFIIKQLINDVKFIPFGSKSKSKTISEIVSDKKIDLFFRDKLFMICEKGNVKNPIFISNIGIDKRVSLDKLSDIFDKSKNNNDDILYIKIAGRV